MYNIQKLAYYPGYNIHFSPEPSPELDFSMVSNTTVSEK